MKKVAFGEWENCYELTSGDFRIIVTTDVGPRIIAGYHGKSPFNIFYVDQSLLGKTGGEKWVNYGGHRLWYAPETRERTYQPDNSTVDVSETADGVSFSVFEKGSGIRKTIEICICEDGIFHIHHIIKNEGIWAVEAAPWALSVMAPGGMAVVPHNTAKEGLLPSKFVSVWPYTKMNDDRINWGDAFVTVRQDSGDDVKPMKIGLNVEEGWMAYINNGFAFVKSFALFNGEKYPDNNCNVEIYTCKEMLEAESLGPLTLLQVGEYAVHSEAWALMEVENKMPSSEDEIVKMLELD